ncbi:MAG: helix-turn-helix domain-containing protein [Chloroflexi bacterium]|nr:helix-turn-helix domain-containing protein [Chloroflexota bacterium]
MGLAAPRNAGDGRSPLDGNPPRFFIKQDGCEFSASCLTCPLAKCKYDERPIRTDSRMAKALKLLDTGVPHRDVAQAVGCHERSVWRWNALRRELAE